MKKRLKAFLSRAKQVPAEPTTEQPGMASAPGRPGGSAVYPMDFHAIDHPLPLGMPNRGDVMLWIGKEVDRHAAEGTLDEGTAKILDAEIERQHLQWQQAITQYAQAVRARNGISLRDDEARSLVAKREELKRSRREVQELSLVEAHYRALLEGAPVTIPPTYESGEEADHAASRGLMPAELTDLDGIDELLRNRSGDTSPPPPADASEAQRPREAAGEVARQPERNDARHDPERHVRSLEQWTNSTRHRDDHAEGDGHTHNHHIEDEDGDDGVLTGA